VGRGENAAVDAARQAIDWAIDAALGAFATAALVSLLGAALSQVHSSGAARALELTAVFTGLLAVGCLASGCVVLLRETKIAVDIVSEEATLLRQQLATRNKQ